MNKSRLLLNLARTKNIIQKQEMRQKKHFCFYQQHGAMMNLSVFVSYVSSNFPFQLESSNDAETRILRTISSGDLEVLLKLAGKIEPVEVFT